MSVTLAFNGVSVQGTVLQWHRSAIEPRIQEWEQFGLVGANQIFGAAKPIDLDVVIWLTGFASAAAIENYVNNTLKPLIGAVASVALTGDVTLTFSNCCMQAIEYPARVDGQEGPLPNNPTTPLARWTDHARLRFRKLR